MKIQGDAESSARTGIPTYSVHEEDRKVSWTISTHDLLRFLDWDHRPPHQRAFMLQLWRNGDPEHGVPMGPRMVEAELHGARSHADVSHLEQHAIVARNTLRNFLGSPAPSVRKLHLYKGGVAGWLGWITVNDRVEAWVTTEGEIIENSRINYGEVDGAAQPISFSDVDGRGFSYAAGHPPAAFKPLSPG